MIPGTVRTWPLNPFMPSIPKNGTPTLMVNREIIQALMGYKFSKNDNDEYTMMTITMTMQHTCINVTLVSTVSCLLMLVLLLKNFSKGKCTQGHMTPNFWTLQLQLRTSNLTLMFPGHGLLRIIHKRRVQCHVTPNFLGVKCLQLQNG